MHFAVSWNEIGRPYQGSIVWKPEQVYGTLSTQEVPWTGSSVATQAVADVVKVARIESGEVNQYLRSIDSIDISVATQKAVDYTFHLEYNPNIDDTLLDFLVDRSGGTVRAVTIEVVANSSGTDAVYLMKGCKCKSVTVSGSQDEPWLVSADFSVKSVATSTATSLRSTSSTAYTKTGDTCMFNVASKVTNSSGLSLAHVTSSFDCTVNHNLQDIWTVGSRDKQAAVECARDINGSCDISLDEGGAIHFGDVINASSANIRTYLGELGSGAPMLTITNLRWDSSSIDVSDANEGMMESCPWTATAITCTEAP
jgi:hypothetical protein